MPSNQTERQGLFKTPRLIEADRNELERLAEASNQHEGLDLPLLLAEPAEQFLYYEAGALIGYLELVGTTEAEACGMVHPDHRRKGIGLALLAAAREEWRERGIASFLLVCDAAGASGTAFASAVGARYRYSEHRMELDAARMPPPSKDPLQLRRATVDDIDDFVRIMVTAFQHDEADISRRRQNTAEDFRDPYRKSYLAALCGKPIGGLEVFQVPEESRVFINSLGVLPKYQHRGYGSQILAETLNALVADGSEHVMIEVQTDNRQAMSLYHACGFDEITTYGFYQVDVP